jgi:putative ubiquitin-RnfH superfamily antitoxin RatB of RatAB toxin-antitoxin module
MALPEHRIAVAYAARERQTVVELTVPAGTTVAEAIERSGIRARHPGIDAAAPLGIWGRSVRPDALVADGDRVEIYRPLAQDPKDARRERARTERARARRR